MFNAKDKRFSLMTINKMFTSYPTFGENKKLKICAFTVINAISKTV